jgi:CheY-like chemotaxis protein
LDPVEPNDREKVVVCAPSARSLAGWVEDVGRYGYRVTVMETLSPAMEAIVAARPDAILIDPGDRADDAVQLVSLMRQIDSLQNLFVGVIAHRAEEMPVIAKPLLGAGASRVFSQRPCGQHRS